MLHVVPRWTITSFSMISCVGGEANELATSAVTDSEKSV